MSDTIFELLKSADMFVEGHFVLTSGRHSSVYLNKDAIYPNVQLTSLICGQMALPFSNAKIEVVVGPALGGIILSQWVTHHLNQTSWNKARAIYAEKDTYGELKLRRGYDQFVAGRRVLVVEDIINTGGSVRLLIQLVRQLNGHAAGVSAICNRGKVTTAQLGSISQLSSLINMEFDSWPSDECPLCTQNILINADLGHG